MGLAVLVSFTTLEVAAGLNVQMRHVDQSAAGFSQSMGYSRGHTRGTRNLGTADIVCVYVSVTVVIACAFDSRRLH